MKQTNKRKWITWAAFFIALPAAYFIIVNILKLIFGISDPYDDIHPFPGCMGMGVSLGWTLNLIILPAPMLYKCASNCNCQNI